MIEIVNVSKKFRIWEDRSRDLKETTINFLRGKKRSFREIWALQKINLEIEEGETVAFIGENGSGKSTLLKVLAGIYWPDEGKIVARGRISTLLELGVGFHPDLTGEENVYLNGAMLGFDHAEMRERIDEIVSFSEIGNFIYSPIRTYSSGMLMRLGFSVATCVNPDILLVDEILAVGDEAFQQKCLGRLMGFKASGKTIIIVSHSMDLVERFCDRVILLQGGRAVADGDPGWVIRQYRALLLSTGRLQGLPPSMDEVEPPQESSGSTEESFTEESSVPMEEPEAVMSSEPSEERPTEETSVPIEEPYVPPPPGAVIREMVLLNSKGVEKERFRSGEAVAVRIVVESFDDAEPAMAIGIVRSDLSPVYGITTLIDRVRPRRLKDNYYSILCRFPSPNLLPGKYIVRGHCGDSATGTKLYDTVEKKLTILGETAEFGFCRLQHSWEETQNGPAGIRKS